MDTNYYGDETVVELYYLELYSLKTEVAYPSGTFKVKPGQTKQAQYVPLQRLWIDWETLTVSFLPQVYIQAAAA